MKKIPVLIIVALALSGCLKSDASPTDAERKVSQMETAMDAGDLPLYLDRSTPSDVIEYMGRSADKMERGSGERRLNKYEMEDGSWLIFAFQPSPGGGLTLEYFGDE